MDNRYEGPVIDYERFSALEDVYRDLLKHGGVPKIDRKKLVSRFRQQVEIKLGTGNGRSHLRRFVNGLGFNLEDFGVRGPLDEDWVPGEWRR